MHVVQDGPRDAPPLLLIHGSGAAGASWGLMVPTLAEIHHVVRIDLPGCGRSAPASTYEVPSLAARVAQVLDDLGLHEVAVAGHSSGGYVATALAEQRPDLVRSITLISTAPAMDAQFPLPFLLRALLSPPLGPLIWQFQNDAWIRKGLNATAAHPVEIPDHIIQGVRGTTFRTMSRILRANGDYITERSVPDRIAALNVPVLVISGAADRRWDPASAHHYTAAPNARLEILPDVGHVPLVEAPELTAELLLSFAAANTPPRS